MKKCNSVSEDAMQKEDISFWGDSININQTRNQNNLLVTQDPRSLGEENNDS